QITIGFIKIKRNEDLWLLFHIGKITKDLNIFNGIGYEYEVIEEYRKFFGRVVIRFKNTSQNMVRRATSVLDDCEVV
ncbi:GIY-YIG nuclease family protein, partial [Acinetobacter baumannii]